MCGEIWLKTKKNRRYGIFQTTLKFFTRVEGGIGGPNPPYGALGSPVKTSRNLFKESNFNPGVCFYGYFCVVLYGRRTQAVLEAGLKIQRFNKSKIRRFFTC